MKVVSLFDGISCGRVALERVGLPVSRYVAFEIDQNAVNCSSWNYPDIEYHGSVVGADFSEFKDIDIVMGGFPCQDLSLAGNRKGLTGKRSSLFWYLAEAIEIIKPRYFLVENNVGMPKEAKETITKVLGVEPIHINSALVSAQNRNRLYWTNIPGVEQPEDKGVFLEDIIEHGVCFKPKSQTILATLYKENAKSMYTRNKNGLLILDNKHKAYCLTSSYNGAVLWNTLKNRQRDMIAGSGAVYGKKYMVKNNQVEISYVTGNEPVIKAFPIDLPDGIYSFRKLTPLECERLQTLPDGYTEMLSDTQRYKVLGNGWNVDTIAHIFNYINVDMLL